MTAKQHLAMPCSISLLLSLQLLKFIPNFTPSYAILYKYFFKLGYGACGGKTPPACTQVASIAEVSLSLGAE